MFCSIGSVRLGACTAAMVTLRADGTLMPVAILSGGQVGFVSGAALPLGTWSHVAVTYDGSMLRLFVNGAEAGSRAATGTLLAVSPAQPGILGGASAFAGVLDDVRLYRRGVSAAEIAQDMARPVEPERSFPVDTPPIPQPSAPRITSLNVSPGRGGRRLFVRGRNFGRRRGTSTITINGTRASAIAWTNRMILAIVPPAATSGPVVVDVGGRTSNAIAFSVESFGIADRGRSDRR
jgi:hypothetical protein